MFNVIYVFQKRTSPLDDAVNTTVTFVDRSLSQDAASQNTTQVALAQLYAHVSSMPESAKKKKLLKQFDKANGAGTPCSARHREYKTNGAGTPQIATDRHKRSKSFGESIKVGFIYLCNLK